VCYRLVSCPACGVILQHKNEERVDKSLGTRLAVDLSLLKHIHVSSTQSFLFKQVQRSLTQLACSTSQLIPRCSTRRDCSRTYFTYLELFLLRKLQAKAASYRTSGRPELSIHSSNRQFYTQVVKSWYSVLVHSQLHC
jgi:hypothetical protein